MLTRDDLFSLEQYAEQRQDFRRRVMEHKKTRHVQLGDHIRLMFEDALTIQYQVQEMLRVERIFERAGIQEELDAYNPLIPDGDNWKATMMIEYVNIDERKQKLADLLGVEERVWVQVDDGDKIYAIADEDMERSTEDKTSSVHFLRFQLPKQDIEKTRQGSEISVGVDHPHYSATLSPLPRDIAKALRSDLV
jgi:hypothetical protein